MSMCGIAIIETDKYGLPATVVARAFFAHLPFPAPGILDGFTTVGIFHPWPGTLSAAL